MCTAVFFLTRFFLQNFWNFSSKIAQKHSKVWYINIFDGLLDVNWSRRSILHKFNQCFQIIITLFIITNGWLNWITCWYLLGFIWAISFLFFKSCFQLLVIWFSIKLFKETSFLYFYSNLFDNVNHLHLFKCFRVTQFPTTYNVQFYTENVNSKHQIA